MEQKKYWNNFYKNSGGRQHESAFARDILHKIDKSKMLIDMGCGNGIDSIFFAKNGIQVIAYDNSQYIIDSLSKRQKIFSKHINPIFVLEDFTLLTPIKEQVGSVYSRFAIHSVNKEGASRMLGWAYDALVKNGLLFIEARSIKDDLYGQGETVEKDAFMTDHYRRFIKLDELKQELFSLGFSIETSVESRHLAIFNMEDPVVIRIIARKSYD